MEKKFFEKPVTYIGEVSINVTDLENSLTFYKNVVGFQVLEQSGRKAVLTADGKTPLLTIEQPEDVVPKEGRTTGLFHFAILLPSRADLAAFLRNLIKKGGPQLRLGASDHIVSEALYFSDPDGNGIEIARDRPSSEWNWKEGEVTMSTEPLDGDGLLAESDKEWNMLPEDTVMGHIHLHVAELEKTEEFYMQGLGFNIVTNFPGALFTSTGGYHHHIALNVWNGTGAPEPATNSAGLRWYTIVFPDETVRREAVDRLKKIGAGVTQANDYYVVKDPSGNTIQMRVNV
ncbi:VOC family protein [Virgibacillus ainsalahensis]